MFVSLSLFSCRHEMRRARDSFAPIRDNDDARDEDMTRGGGGGGGGAVLINFDGDRASVSDVKVP